MLPIIVYRYVSPVIGRKRESLLMNQPLERTALEKMAPAGKPLIYRQFLSTRITHWLWAICLFFLVLSGLQIFNARPDLYIGQQSGFGFDNAILRFDAADTANGPRGYTTIFGKRFDTTGVFGLSGSGDNLEARGFPAWATIPSYQDLATGRVIHFFFAWVLVATLLTWLVSSLVNGHLVRDLIPRRKDLRRLGSDLADHLRLRFHHRREYNVLQKFTYAFVLIILLPLMVLTGLTMSPGVDASFPFLVEIFGGRQTARTIHFLGMALIVLFFLVHMLMVLATGPLNALRSIITGRYRTDTSAPDATAQPGE
jgi:thiosulfate reductase cytochrome b subunit